MSLTMIGIGASFEFRWRRWALLRDAIVEHLEGGVTGSRFPEFAAIGNALGVPSTRLVAARLSAELAAIRDGLAERSVGELVIGVSTSNVLYPTIRLGATRLLTEVERNQIAGIGNARTLAEYFSAMLDSMAELCAHPEADGTIEVIDG